MRIIPSTKVYKDKDTEVIANYKNGKTPPSVLKNIENYKGNDMEIIASYKEGKTPLSVLKNIKDKEENTRLIDIITKAINELKSKIRNSQLDKTTLVQTYGLQFFIYESLLVTLKKNNLGDIYLEGTSEGTSKIPSELATYYLYQDVVDDPSNLNVSIQEKIEYSLQEFIDKYCVKKIEEK